MRGLDGLPRQRRDAADQHQRDERDPAPDVGHDRDREGEGRVGQPRDVRQRRDQQAEEGVEQAEFGVEHEPERDPDQRRAHREGQDQERAHGQPQPSAGREQERDAERQERGQGDGQHRVDGGDRRRVPEVGILEQRPAVVLEADERAGHGGFRELPGAEAEDERLQERPDRGREHHHHRGQHHQVLQMTVAHWRKPSCPGNRPECGGSGAPGPPEPP